MPAARLARQAAVSAYLCRVAVQLVWFKRDLRVDDHRPLVAARRAGPVLCVYVFEPDVIALPESDPRHWQFVIQSLADLREELRARGADLVLRTGDVVDVFDELCAEVPVAGVWSHEGTGLLATYERDKRVKRWAKDRGVPWTEIPQFGVFRPLDSRDGWAKRRARRMHEALVAAPARLVAAPVRDPGALPTLSQLGLAASEAEDAQVGGLEAGRTLLTSFISARGRDYRTSMSSPLSAWDSCSRISPYLAYGTLSLRRAVRTAEAARRKYAERARAGRSDSKDAGEWARSMKAFAERLTWHCHFTQKLESEPEIEIRNMSRTFDGMRTEDPADWTTEQRRRFDAFRAGRTGYPMVDASVRCLRATGWINFRMRAMLVSFASYYLWLHWKPTAEFLARLFVDFEPGIHYPQVQMQAGTTGISANRVYSPAKQLRDQDPQGEFVRRWVPELADVPVAVLDRPGQMSLAEQARVGCRVGPDYPEPIVVAGAARAEAARRLAAASRGPAARAEARRVFERHGSRRGPRGRRYRGSPSSRRLP